MARASRVKCVWVRNLFVSSCVGSRRDLHRRRHPVIHPGRHAKCGQVRTSHASHPERGGVVLVACCACARVDVPKGVRAQVVVPALIVVLHRSLDVVLPLLLVLVLLLRLGLMLLMLMLLIHARRPITPTPRTHGPSRLRAGCKCQVRLRIAHWLIALSLARSEHRRTDRMHHAHVETHIARIHALPSRARRLGHAVHMWHRWPTTQTETRLPRLLVRRADPTAGRRWTWDGNAAPARERLVIRRLRHRRRRRDRMRSSGETDKLIAMAVYAHTHVGTAKVCRKVLLAARM
jgi:hypothetical protein